MEYQTFLLRFGAFTIGIEAIPSSAPAFGLMQAMWTHAPRNSTSSPSDMIMMEYGKVFFRSTADCNDSTTPMISFILKCAEIVSMHIIPPHKPKIEIMKVNNCFLF